MIVRDGQKWACRSCITGHRSSKCTHEDRELFPIAKKGRPSTQCKVCQEAKAAGAKSGDGGECQCVSTKRRLKHSTLHLQPKGGNPMYMNIHGDPSSALPGYPPGGYPPDPKRRRNDIAFPSAGPSRDVYGGGFDGMQPYYGPPGEGFDSPSASSATSSPANGHMSAQSHTYGASHAASGGSNYLDIYANGMYRYPPGYNQQHYPQYSQHGHTGHSGHPGHPVPGYWQQHGHMQGGGYMYAPSPLSASQNMMPPPSAQQPVPPHGDGSQPYEGMPYSAGPHYSNGQPGYMSSGYPQYSEGGEGPPGGGSGEFPSIPRHHSLPENAYPRSNSIYSASGEAPQGQQQYPPESTGPGERGFQPTPARMPYGAGYPQSPPPDSPVYYDNYNMPPPVHRYSVSAPPPYQSQPIAPGRSAQHYDNGQYASQAYPGTPHTAPEVIRGASDGVAYDGPPPRASAFESVSNARGEGEAEETKQRQGSPSSITQQEQFQEPRQQQQMQTHKRSESSVSQSASSLRQRTSQTFPAPLSASLITTDTGFARLSGPATARSETFDESVREPRSPEESSRLVENRKRKASDATV